MNPKNYLDQLKQQRSTLEEILMKQREEMSLSTFEGVRITAQYYFEILGNAIDAASSLIQYLDHEPGK